MKDQSQPPKPAETKASSGKTEGKTLLTEGDDAAVAEAKPAGAPEKYGDFTVPEGFTLAPEVAAEAGTLFKGLGLSQEQAQSLIDFHVSKTQEAAAQPGQAYSDMRAGWRQEVTSDPELGGKIDSHVKPTIAKALASLGDSKLVGEFKAAMDLTGAGDHPAFVKAFYKLSQKLTEGTHVKGNGPANVKSPTGKPPDAAHALFPTRA